MTREHRVTLSLDEIIGVRWTCNACGAAVTFGLEKPVRLLYECPGCMAVFRDRGLQPQDDAFEQFVQALRDARRLAQQAKLPASLSLEFLDDQAGGISN